LYKVHAGAFTTQAGEDLIATIETALSVSHITVRRLLINHSAAAIITINGGAEIPLYLDIDGRYRFATNLNEVQITSLVVKDAENSMYVLVVYD
jgi:hypothetical protein